MITEDTITEDAITEEAITEDTIAEDIKWLRPTDICKDAQFLTDGMSRFDVSQVNQDWAVVWLSW